MSIAQPFANTNECPLAIYAQNQLSLRLLPLLTISSFTTILNVLISQCTGTRTHKHLPRRCFFFLACFRLLSLFCHYSPITISVQQSPCRAMTTTTTTTAPSDREQKKTPFNVHTHTRAIHSRIWMQNRLVPSFWLLATSENREFVSLASPPTNSNRIFSAIRPRFADEQKSVANNISFFSVRWLWSEYLLDVNSAHIFVVIIMHNNTLHTVHNFEPIFLVFGFSLWLGSAVRPEYVSKLVPHIWNENKNLKCFPPR